MCTHPCLCARVCVSVCVHMLVCVPLCVCARACVHTHIKPRECWRCRSPSATSDCSASDITAGVKAILSWLCLWEPSPPPTPATDPGPGGAGLLCPCPHPLPPVSPRGQAVLSQDQPSARPPEPTGLTHIQGPAGTAPCDLQPHGFVISQSWRSCTGVMYGPESWTVKKAERRRAGAFELCCWRRLLRVPWTTRRSNQSILKEISPGCSLEGLMLKLKLQCFGHIIRRAAAKSLQSCPTLCDPIDGSPPGSTVPGISRQEHWSGLPFPSPMQESEK